MALFAGKYLHKGDRVAVAGTLYISELRSDDGKSRKEVGMLAIALELVKDDDNIQVGGLPKRGNEQGEVRCPGLHPIRGKLLNS
jgi:single-stranded DNA-binding protein